MNDATGQHGYRPPRVDMSGNAQTEYQFGSLNTSFVSSPRSSEIDKAEEPCEEKEKPKKTSTDKKNWDLLWRDSCFIG
jgi:hypothetical protein